MELKRTETNNAIVVKLENVRKHPNPKVNRIKLATVLGTQVIVGADSKEGDIVVYFDANLRLSPDLMFYNNLYSNKDMNWDKTKKGFFGKNGRVRAIKFQEEMSNGFVCPIGSLILIDGLLENDDALDLKVGDEFTHINGVEICSKYIADISGGLGDMPGRKGNKRRNIVLRNRYSLLKRREWTDMFWKHWDTKQLMREKHRFPGGIVYIEEKVHGTSGRTANVLVHQIRRRYQVWKPKVTSTWKVISGTRRRDGVRGYMSRERREIHEKLKPHIRKGEELYYEIVGYEKNGKLIQSLNGVRFTYGCKPREYKVVLYRVTQTNVDGYRVELNREQVYRRADELGLERPMLLSTGFISRLDDQEQILNYARGKSLYDAGHCLEGIVVWFKRYDGIWTCLKHKSEEFILLDSRNKDEGGGDIEDTL